MGGKAYTNTKILKFSSGWKYTSSLSWVPRTSWIDDEDFVWESILSSHRVTSSWDQSRCQ